MASTAAPGPGPRRVLDALVLAASARLPLATLPPVPEHDACGLPVEIACPRPPRAGSTW